jgi:Cys-rich protein (TIGR01571 family)
MQLKSFDGVDCDRNDGYGDENSQETQRLTHSDTASAGLPFGTPSSELVPSGQWRDGFRDIFRYGVCHASCFTSCCCVPVAAGQVITRLGLSWYGKAGTSSSAEGSAFRKLATMFAYFILMRVLFIIVIACLDPNIELERDEWVQPPTAYYIFAILDEALSWTYIVFVVVLLWNIRNHIRQRYAIPATSHNVCEDVCCSLWCPCLVVAQMLRHTTDYNKCTARYCSDTGLSPHVFDPEV